MRISDILRSKGSAVATVTETTTVTGLLAELAVHNIGATVVIGTAGQGRSDSGINTAGVVGIVSERDVARELHRQGPGVLQRPVSDIMSSTLVTCGPEDTVDVLAELMTHNRVRHIPVLDAGRLIGIVSLGDVVKNRLEELAAERQQLRDYITQSG
ncbi:MAG: CBS domain-containing protein [Mycobacterium sp.]|nr:CBS domain-containing protein [Mycobacterium sp.]